MKTAATCVLFICIASQAIGKSYEDDVAKLISQHDEFAKRSCERIKNDEAWKKTADILNERTKLFNSLTESERRAIDLSVKNFSDSESELRKSDGIYRKIYNERTEKVSSVRKALIQHTDLTRVLKTCGEELFNSGFLPPAIGSYQTSMVSTERIKEEINELTSRLKQHDSSLIDIARNARGESFAQVESDILTSSYNSKIQFNSEKTLRLFWFPMHDLFKDGDQIYANQIDFDKLTQDNQYSITTAEKNLKRDQEKNTESAKKKSMLAAEVKERDLRIDRIKKGDLKSAKSCIEIAVALIPKDELGGNFDIALSKDFQDVHLKPSNKLYAGIGKVIDSEKNKITVIQNDEFRKKQFIFQLRNGDKTIWFGDKISNGTYLTFVGRYVDNEKTAIRQGANLVEIPSRAYDLVCASSK